MGRTKPRSLITRTGSAAAQRLHLPNQTLRQRQKNQTPTGSMTGQLGIEWIEEESKEMAMDIQYRPEGLPQAHGLYDPRNEHDACGIGLIANISNAKSHRMVADGLSILKNLEHRGAVGADPKAGDGAGILIQIPHNFFTEESGA